MGLRTVTVRVTGSGTSLLGRIAVVSVVTVSRISMSPRKAASAAGQHKVGAWLRNLRNAGVPTLPMRKV